MEDIKCRVLCRVGRSGDEFPQQGRNWGPDCYCLARVKEAFWKRRFLNNPEETVGVVWKEGGEREQCLKP